MTSDLRAERLRKLFYKVIHGEQPIKTTQNAQLFLEAAQQQPPSSCIETILSKAAGLGALREAVRVDISPAFIVSHTLPFLQYLSDPGIKALADGQLLREVLVVIAKPPTVWNATVQLFRNHKIPENLLAPFGWLAVELVSLPAEAGVDVLDDVQDISDRKTLLKSEHHEARELGYRIKKALQLHTQTAPEKETLGSGPGGRHDNDFADFRETSIYPTRDEFLCSQPPFYQTAHDVFETPLERRANVHLDNQFRLLREDMLAELREDQQVATGAKKGRRVSVMLGHLRPFALEFESTTAGGSVRPGIDQRRFKKCTMLLECFQGLQFLQKMSQDERRKYLKNQPGLLRHQSFGVVCRGNTIFGFAFVDRDIDLLVRDTPIISLQFTDGHGFRDTLLALQLPDAFRVQFVLVDTAVFAYEPVLAELQKLKELPLQDALVSPSSALTRLDDAVLGPELSLSIGQLEAACRDGEDHEGSILLPCQRKIRVDHSQMMALLHALTSPVSSIQGPPGTGKSFIGAQIANYFFKAGKTILVISYTNHALDQFLEDLLDTGIPTNDIVRIGAKAKSSPRTASLLLQEHKSVYKRSRDAWNIINLRRDAARDAAREMAKSFQSCCELSPRWTDISEYLEFSDEDQRFYTALRMPAEGENGGWRRTGRDGRAAGADYLYLRWIDGVGPGVFAKGMSPESRDVWALRKSERRDHDARWKRLLLEERLQNIQELFRQYSQEQERLEVLFSEGDASTLAQTRVIGCTTTGAAKHSRLIRAAQPDVVIVEEAGEILESHVLTALVPTVKQLVLIGDHKQLRPKINNYSLSVEKGEGFDLNRSLFERLILQGAKHVTLTKQHRMVPEISLFPREMTYPDLVDGPKTSGRPAMRGIRDRVVFLNHSVPEESDRSIKDRRDIASMKESKKNKFEADMVLRCIKFFGQQGYKSSQIVILTPYLGQVRVLQDLLLQNQHDPELSEMDKRDMIRAGLMSEAASKVDREPIRVSTIDNYQGEENDIVIASLTRSNDSGDIGFMAAPERLNVLITRARNCLVMIGNMVTFMQSKKGRPVWHPFFELLKTHGHLYDGLPVRCEKHPEKESLLKEPIDFDKSSPDGGCTEPCLATLKCGKHKCKFRCHRVTDHSQAPCRELVDRVCERQHKTRVPCAKQSDGCQKCIREDKEFERRARRDLQLEEERQRRQAEYLKQLQELDDEIDHERRISKYKAEEEDQKKTLEQRQADLAAAKTSQRRSMRIREQAREAKLKASKEANKNANAQMREFTFPDVDDSRAEWEHIKATEGYQSQPLDDLMEMIGLEEVKQEFLSIKSKVDLTTRQGTSLASERFSCSMLGNPGTGKTTVARLYAQFLTEVGVIPGNSFKENTGAGLANIGVSGCKKLVDEILNDGGGVLFVDEAYQLTSGNNPGGAAVLDYLLAEVENLRGKVVFVLAGYHKQMESFFAHNPGLPSRFPIEMNFGDYSDDELLRILELKVNSKFNGNMECEDGLRGLYCRIIARRIGRGRGKDGFGNARAVENTLSAVYKRQANRLRRERKAGSKPSDLFLSKEDLIGPEPAEALTRCEGWKELQGLIGLGAVKDAVRALVDSIQQNYSRELAEKPLIEYSLNKVFLGNPGTGKTTVAKIYGQILVALGLLSKGEVVVKNPSDFVGAALGQSEQNTKGILASSVGKVLVIDEAYGLYGGGGNQGASSDPYKTAVIDTIVAEVQSVPGDDRCVLLLGYKDQMETMFQNVNPGLSRRFPIASAFVFDDFSQDELRKIVHLKLKNQGYQASGEAVSVAMEMLDRARNRPNFGNAGEVDILLNETKARHQRRLTLARQKAGKNQALPKGALTDDDTLLTAEDFDPNFDRAKNSTTNIKALFKDTVGSEKVVALLEGYQDTVRRLKSLDMDPKEAIPFNFLFRGPPGTGKTTTARKMGKVFYDMGFLATGDVHECSATDLIGQYVGQTGPKVQQLLDKALGRVLFIDEAYRLAEGHFAQEAMDEIVDSVTKPRYHKKLIIILAGYDDDINRLMSVNAGLTSRFPEVVDFHPLSPDKCMTLFIQLLQKKQQEVALKGKKRLHLDCLVDPSSEFSAFVALAFEKLSAQANWASARDVQTLQRRIFGAVLNADSTSTDDLVLTEEMVRRTMGEILREREALSRAAAPMTLDLSQRDAQEPRTAQPPPPRQASTVTKTTTVVESAQAEPEDAPEKDRELEIVLDDPARSRSATRDVGVSDAVWEQLQRDQRAEEEQEKKCQWLKERARTATAAARDEIVRLLVEEERRRKEALELKKKLEKSGKCPAGFQWIAQAGGFRCAGGSHFVSSKELGGL